MSLNKFASSTSVTNESQEHEKNDDIRNGKNNKHNNSLQIPSFAEIAPNKAFSRNSLGNSFVINVENIDYYNSYSDSVFEKSLKKPQQMSTASKSKSMSSNTLLRLDSDGVPYFDKYSIEDIAKLTREGLSSIDQIESIINSDDKNSAKSSNTSKIKQLVAKNHAKLKHLDFSSFEIIEGKPISPDDSMSARSTNSSGSGSGDHIIAGWSLGWTLENQSRHTNKNNSNINNNSSNSLDTQLKSDVRCVKGVCFLRSGYGVVTTEPRSSRMQIFSIKRGHHLVTISAESPDVKTAKSISNITGNRYFRPYSICETHRDDTVAVSDRNKIYYVHIAEGESHVYYETVVKNRMDITGLAWSYNEKIMLIDNSLTNKPHIGLYDTRGKLVREFKGYQHLEPSYITWSNQYQVAAVSDSRQRTISFYNGDGQIVNTYSSSSSSLMPSSSSAASAASAYRFCFPSGVAWLPQSQLLVADTAEHKVVALDFRNLKSEIAVETTDGLMNPVAIATNARGSRFLITEEERCYGGKDKYRLKSFTRKGVHKEDRDSLHGLIVD